MAGGDGVGFNFSSVSPVSARALRALCRAFAACAILLAAQPSIAADVSIKPGDQVVRVVVTDAAGLARLEALDLDIWSHDYGIGPIEVHASIAERQALTAAGFSYDVVQPDLLAAYQMEQAPAPHGPGDFNAYMDLPAIVAYINGLATARPDLCSVSSIGQSIENRDIWVLKITGPGAGPKPGVFYHGLQHCREWITGPAVLYLANYLVTQYDNDPCVRELVNQTEFHLAPCINPDGYAYTWINSNTRLWRKNRRQNSGGSIGVDLNRNWGYGWGGGGSSGSQSSDTYRGTAAFSEPETAAIRDFMIAHPHIRAHMDYHSYGQLIMWPFGTECVAPTEPDASIYAGLGTTMNALIGAVHSVNYTFGPLCQTLYQASGCSVDYMYGTQDRFGMTIELRPVSGNPGFLLPPSQILPTCEENLPAIVYLSRWASTGIVLEPIAPIPNAITPNTATTLNLAIKPNFETYAPDTARIHYRLGGSGPFFEESLQPVAGTEYDAHLPGIPCGADIEFYVTAMGSAGYVARIPCGAPDVVYSATAVGACSPSECSTIPGDMNGDSIINGGDINGFAQAMSQPPNYAICADLMVPYGTLDHADLSTLIDRLLAD